jgi:hypothetical protein
MDSAQGTEVSIILGYGEASLGEWFQHFEMTESSYLSGSGRPRRMGTIIFYNRQ